LAFFVSTRVSPVGFDAVVLWSSPLGSQFSHIVIHSDFMLTILGYLHGAWCYHIEEFNSCLTDNTASELPLFVVTRIRSIPYRQPAAKMYSFAVIKRWSWKPLKVKAKQCLSRPGQALRVQGG